METNTTYNKIFKHYFAAVTKETYQYDGRVIHPKTLSISLGVVNDIKCKPACGACCYKFSLDYLPTEPHPEGVTECEVEFNGSTFIILRDNQDEVSGKYCKYLRDDARCGIHGMHPFSCDIELLKLYQTGKDSRAHTVTFMNAHRMARVGFHDAARDGHGILINREHAALCRTSGPTQYGADEAVRKLKRLLDWTTYFKLDTHIPEVIEAIEGGCWKSKIPSKFYPPAGT